VYLEGALQTRKWTDQSGQERYTTEVIVDRFRGELVLLDSRNSGDGSDHPPATQQKPQGNSYAQKDNSWSNPSDLDDEIPF
jgi:single-strand DNA-binding protein